MPNVYRKVYPGIRSGGFQVIAAEEELNLVVNAYYDEASGNWYRIDESKGAARIVVTPPDRNFRIQHVDAGTGAISWGIGVEVSYDHISIGKVRYIRSYSQDTEPDIDTSTVALWEDTINNRYWFIWDKDGTQRKVELT